MRLSCCLRPIPVLLGVVLGVCVLGVVAAQNPLQPPTEPATRKPPVDKATVPLPPGVLARVDGEEITVDQYRDFLYREFHLDRFLNLVDRILIEKKAGELGVVVTDEEIRDAADRDIQSGIERVHKGDRASYEASLARRLRTIDSHRAVLMWRHRTKALVDRCVMKLRKITEQDVRAKFLEVYGPGGVHVQVRHLLLRKKRTAAGNPGSGRDLMAEAQAIMDELEKDPGRFVELVKAHSEDPMTRRNDGFVPNYRSTLFGAAFHEVLTGLQAEGEIGGPVESDYGVHIMQLVKRTVTRFEEVSDEIRAELKRRRPTPKEKGLLFKRLRTDAKIEM